MIGQIIIDIKDLFYCQPVMSWINIFTLHRMSFNFEWSICPKNYLYYVHFGEVTVIEYDVSTLSTSSLRYCR